MNRDQLSLHAMLQKGMNNDIPETILEKCPDADRLMIENLLRIAKTELVVLNLALILRTVRLHRIIRISLSSPFKSKER